MAELEFKVRADLQELTELERKIDEVKTKVIQAAQAGDKVAQSGYEKTLQSLNSRHQELSDSLLKTSSVMRGVFLDEIKKVDKSLREQGNTIENQKWVIKRLSHTLADAEKAYQALVKAKGEHAAKNSAEKKDVEELTAELIGEKEALKELQYEYDKTLHKKAQLRQDADLGDAGEQTDELGVALDVMMGKLKQVSAMFVGGMSVGSFVNQVVQVRGQFQQLEIAFNTMLGSAEKAEALMSQLVDTAAKTPFDLQGVTQGAKQLLAYGVQAEEVNETLTRLGDIAAGLSIPLGDLVYLYGTTMTQGRMFTQDLRQFMGRGIPIAEELAKQFGVTKDEVGELVTKGKIGAEEFKQAIWSMSNEGGKFGGLMEAQSKTITGQISNIEDAIDNMFNDIGKQAEPAINAVLGGVGTIVEHYKELAKVIGVAVTAYGAYKAIMMIVSALESRRAKIIATMKILMRESAASGAVMTAATARDTAVTELNTAAKTRAITAMKNLTAATLANPYAWLAVTITGLGYVIYEYATRVDAATAAEEGWKKSLEDVSGAVDERKQKINELVSTIKSAESTSLDKTLAFDELKKLAPSIADTYSSMEALAAVDMSKINKDVAEFMDTFREDELKKRKERLDELLAAYQHGTMQADKIKDALKDEFNTVVPFLATFKEVEQVIKDLSDSATSELDRWNEAKERAAMPVELRIKLAEDAVQQTQEGLNLVSDLIVAMKADAERNPLKIPIAESETLAKVDAITAQIQAKIEQLKAQQEKDPVKFKANGEQALRAYTFLLSQISMARANAMATGQFHIPITISTMYQQIGGQLEKDNAALKAEQDAKKAADEAKKAADKAKADAEKQRKKSAAQAAANKAKREAEERRRAEERAGQMLADQIRRNTDNEIALIEDAHERRLEQIERDWRKEKEAIERWREDIKTQNEKAKTTTGADGLTDAQREAYDKAVKNADDKHDRTQKDYEKSHVEADAQSWRNYLVEYGSFEEKRLAITEDYEKKIKDAQTEGEKQSLREQLNERLHELNEEIKQTSTSWGVLFGDVVNKTTEQLARMKDELHDMLSAENLGADEFAQIVQQIDKINDVVVRNKNERGGIFFGWGNDEYKSQTNALTAQRDSKRGIEEQMRTQVELARMAMLAAQADPQSKIEGTAEWVAAVKAAKDYEETQKKANKATLDAQEADEALTKHTTNLAKKFDALRATLDKWNQNIQALPDLAESLGISSDSKAGQKIQGIADIANGAMGAMADFASGNYVGAAAKALGAIGTLGDVLGIGGESDKNYAEDMEKLTNANSALKESIGKLSEKMEHSSLIDALKTYDKQMQNYEQIEKNMQEQLSRSGASYNSGKWGTGIGGSHSTNYKIDKGMSKGDWQAISKAVGKEIRSAGELWALSSEEMGKLSTEAVTQWIKLLELADDGHQDLTNYLKEYAELYKTAEQVTDNMKQTATQTTFDSLVGNFKSAIMDMNKTSADFANDFEELMKNAMLSAMVEGDFSEDLRKWHDDFYEAMASDGLSKEEQEQLRKRYMDMANAAKEQRDALYDTMNWSDNASQNASSKGFATMSQDTASELNGRFTAMQIAMERVAGSSDTGLQQLVTMSATQAGYYPQIVAIGDNILRQQAESYIELQQINERQEGWNKPMKQAFADIAKMAKKIDTL